MYNLFLDDIRYPNDVTWINLPLVDWTIVRNYNQFVKIITEKGLPEYCSLDHDLSSEHYPNGVGIWIGDPRADTIKLDYESYKEKTGYHCAKWLLHYCFDRKLLLPVCLVHSLNPVGRDNIRCILDNYKMMCNNRD